MASTISVYYKYTNDIDILLGTKEKPPHDGVYKQTDDYVMYNDGYLVQTGTTDIPVTYRGDVTINFKVPFINTNYNVSFSSDFTTIKVSSSSKYEDHYSATVNTIIPGVNPGSRININYTATGYWK